MLNEFGERRAGNEYPRIDVKRNSGEPCLARQVDGGNPFIYTPSDQGFGALLRGGGHAFAIHGRARLVRQVQGMKYERS